MIIYPLLIYLSKNTDTPIQIIKHNNTTTRIRTRTINLYVQGRDCGSKGGTIRIEATFTINFLAKNRV